MIALYRKPDGREWSGQDLERATGGAVTRSYVSNLKKGCIGNPGLAKLETKAKAMGFPPALWFGATGDEQIPDGALLAAMDVLRDMDPGSFTIGRDKYTNHQFPDPYKTSSGAEFAKPPNW